MNNPVQTSKVPNYHESSAQRTQKDSDALGRSWIKGRTIAGQVDSLIREMVTLDRIVKGLQRRILGGGSGASGWAFQTPNVELDPTIAVTANTVVYISSSSHPLASGTYTDLVLNTIKSSRPGYWIAKQNVPPAVTVSGVLKYNVPQLPYPGATGGSYSTNPYTGDLDGANVFWGFLGQTPNC